MYNMFQLHHSEERLHLETTTQRLLGALMDAHMKLQNIAHRQLQDYDLRVQMWTQVWASSNCGFGPRDVDKQHTEFTVVVVRASPLTEAAVVWMAGKYAYTVLEPTPMFFYDVEHHCLWGQGTPHRNSRYDRVQQHVRLTVPPPPEEQDTLPMAI